jgi:hypothetical protein
LTFFPIYGIFNLGEKRMRNYIIVIFVLFLFSCSPENFDYKIQISEKEYTIMRKYMRNYKDIKRIVLLEKNHISSNDKALLLKIKMRLAGLACSKYPRDGWSYYPYIPIITNYHDNYYYVWEIEKINWLNDEDIFKKLFPNYHHLIDVNIPDKLLNLTKEEFIEEYFLKDNDGKYKCKLDLNMGFFYEDKEENKLLFDSIVYLCIVKYNLLVTLFGSKIYFTEILWKNPNGT